MSMKKIIIHEMCDAFNICVLHEDGKIDEHRFNQEDNKMGLVDVFVKLGFETEYEEIY